jgi:hypothetical protein
MTTTSTTSGQDRMTSTARSTASTQSFAATRPPMTRTTETAEFHQPRLSGSSGRSGGGRGQPVSRPAPPCSAIGPVTGSGRAAVGAVDGQPGDHSRLWGSGGRMNPHNRERFGVVPAAGGTREVSPGLSPSGPPIRRRSRRWAVVQRLTR